MNRRTLLLLATGLLVLAVLGALESQSILSGWWKGEVFFRGRPTSFWERDLDGYTAGTPWSAGWRRKPTSIDLYVYVPAFLRSRLTLTEPQIMSAGSECLAVLREIHARRTERLSTEMASLDPNNSEHQAFAWTTTKILLRIHHLAGTSPYDTVLEISEEK